MAHSYVVDIRLVQVVTLLGCVNVVAANPDEAAEMARRAASEGNVVITKADRLPVTVGHEVLAVVPDKGWNGADRRTVPRWTGGVD